MMAVDADFEEQSRKHTGRKQGYRKRGEVQLVALNTNVSLQVKLDLDAMAAAERLSLGQCIDKLVSREVLRRSRRLGCKPEIQSGSLVDNNQI